MRSCYLLAIFSPKIANTPRKKVFFYIILYYSVLFYITFLEDKPAQKRIFMRNIMLAFDIARFVPKEVRTAITHEKDKK